MDEFYSLECPHCSHNIIVYKNELHCKIFRHGVFKRTGEQINPHLSKQMCERLLAMDLIYGCGKPFQVDLDFSNNIYASICDYI